MLTNHENVFVRIEEGEEQAPQHINVLDVGKMEIVLKLYIKKKCKSTTDYKFSERVPVCDQMNYPGYTKRLSLPYYLELESFNDRVVTEKEDDNGKKKLDKITKTFLNAEVLKENNINGTDIQWILDEMIKIVYEANGRRTKLSDALSENPYKPPRTLFQIVNGESSKRDLPPEDKKKEFCLQIKEGENKIVSLIKFLIIMVIGCFTLPIMLISLLLAFIYDTCISLVYGKHKVLYQEQNWFEEMHRKNKDCNTESIDNYIKKEIPTIFSQVYSKYPLLKNRAKFLVTAETDSDSDEFIIAFMGRKETYKEFKSSSDHIGDLAAGFVVNIAL